MKIIYYVYVLLFLDVMGLGVQIAKQDAESFGKWLGMNLMQMPLYGRILGWW